VKVRELTSRCLKARFVSWITVSTQPVLVPTLDGSGCVIAVYSNGKYVTPQVVHIPSGVPEDWGPDGPIHPSQQPPTDPEGGPSDGTPESGS
jgi:hypothetical protein